MKITIGLLLLQLFIFDISCHDGKDILAKFHQNGYKIRDVRAEVSNYTEKHFNKFEIKTYKYNRTTPAINVTINLKTTAKVDQLEILVQAYKFLSNEYRHFPMRYQVNLKRIIDSNAIGIKEINKCGNINSDTIKTLKKDFTYYVCNFVIDETRCPPLIPSGRYKLEYTVLYLDEDVATIYGYGEVYTPIPYPKH